MIIKIFGLPKHDIDSSTTPKEINCEMNDTQDKKKLITYSKFTYIYHIFNIES